ncbi:MAG: DUF1998 domain-containing protein [Bacillota bacterium]|nr:DUF1998 domain-containing protein [Bacillota bacterium]
MLNKLGEIRPNQLITTFGPGSIIDAVKDSVTVLDTNYWTVWGKTIHDSRLASYLGVTHFKTPKTSFKENIPVISFPNYHVCSKGNCENLFDLSLSFDLDKYLSHGPVCPLCGFQAYPARFIVACADGHMDDFPWRWWVHEGHTSCDKPMKFQSSGRSSSLADLRVTCECSKSRNMSGATQKENFSDLKCSGRHPQRPLEVKNHKGFYSNCEKQVIPSQRGASNVYFPVIRSAISIPPWINPLFSLVDEHYRDILNYRSDFGEAGVQKIYEKYFEERFSREEFDDALKKRDEKIKEFIEIKEMEYAAITRFNDVQFRTDVRFFKAEEEVLPEHLKPFFSRLIKIHRLREVMVLLGFMRMDSPEPEVDDPQNIVQLTKSRFDSWLPAVEINGEGIFIEFNRSKIQQWFLDGNINKISGIYKEVYTKFCESKGWEHFKERDAAYVLLHTFSHLMIKELAMQCGYSSASIKERIYSSDAMCGVLIYTGSSDKEGSLGGLVEMGEMSNFGRILKSALETALLCTTDPECMFNGPTVERINGSACHSCSMISETSCENGNRLLDRGLVVPLPNNDSESYFRELVNELCGLEL